MAEPTSGTVTFLFTDLEGSTRLWEHHPEAMRTAHPWTWTHNTAFESALSGRWIRRPSRRCGTKAEL